MGKREGIMLAGAFNERKFNKWVEEYGFVFVQPKLNGERLRWDGADLWTSEANLCDSLPKVLEALHTLFPRIPLDGEAYVHGWTRQRIHSVVSRTVHLHPQHDQVSFHVFDIPMTDYNQIDRFRGMENKKSYFASTPNIVPVDTRIAKSLKDVETYTLSLVRHGYEGSIVRDPRGMYKALSRRYMMKWKPGGRDKYKLIEMLEGRGKYKGTLGALIVEAENSDRFHVGSFKLTDGERNALWKKRKELEGKVWVQIRYTELTERGVPPSGVFEMVIE